MPGSGYSTQLSFIVLYRGEWCRQNSGKSEKYNEKNCHFLKISPPFSGFNKLISVKYFFKYVPLHLNRDIKKSPQI